MFVNIKSIAASLLALTLPPAHTLLTLCDDNLLPQRLKRVAFPITAVLAVFATLIGHAFTMQVKTR
jgi:hypothetical protein